MCDITQFEQMSWICSILINTFLLLRVIIWSFHTHTKHSLWILKKDKLKNMMPLGGRNSMSWALLTLLSWLLPNQAVSGGGRWWFGWGSAAGAVRLCTPAGLLTHGCLPLGSQLQRQGQPDSWVELHSGPLHGRETQFTHRLRRRVWRVWYARVSGQLKTFLRASTADPSGCCSGASSSWSWSGFGGVSLS